MSLSEKLAQAAAARARREAAEAAATAATTGAEGAVGVGATAAGTAADPAADAAVPATPAVRFDDITIDLTTEAPGAPTDAPTSPVTGGEPTNDGDAPSSASPKASTPARTITIDELKRRREARGLMRPQLPSPFEAAPAARHDEQASGHDAITPVRPLTPGLTEERRQALLDRLAELRVEQYASAEAEAPAALLALRGGESTSELPRLARRTDVLNRATVDDGAPSVEQHRIEAEVEDQDEAPVVIEAPPTSDPFAGLRPNTRHLPSPKPARLRLRRNRAAAAPAIERPAATGPIPGPRCASCGGPARIDIVDRASARRHLSCVCCGRLWEEHLQG